MSAVSRNAAVISLAIASVWSSGARAQDSLIGAGVQHRPSYDGSDVFEGNAVPVLRFSRGAWFARTTDGLAETGAQFSLGEGVMAGLQASYESGPRDDDPGLAAGAHVEWKTHVGPAPVYTLARWRKHLESEKGSSVDARVAAGLYQRGRVTAGAMGQVAWADEVYRFAYYGVHESGLLYGSLGLFASYEITTSLTGVGGMEVRQLASDLERSEFVEHRTNGYFNVGVTYRF